MEAIVNTSCHTQTLVQVTLPAPGRLDCMRKALAYLSGMPALFVSLISSLCTFLIVLLTALFTVLLKGPLAGLLAALLAGLLTSSLALLKRYTGVTEGETVCGFRKRKAHDRRHALFTGNAKKTFKLNGLQRITVLLGVPTLAAGKIRWTIILQQWKLQPVKSRYSG